MFTTGGGGSFGNVGFTTGLILPYLEIVFVGLHILLRPRIFYYACGKIITLAAVRLRLPYDILGVLPAVRLRSLPPAAPL